MYILSFLFYSLVLYEEQTWDQTTNFSIEIYSYAYEAIHLSTCFESLSKSSSIHKHTILALCSSYSMNSTTRLNTLLSLLQFDCLYYLSIIYPVLPSISSIQPSEISSSLLQQSLYQLLHCYSQYFHQFTQQQANQLHSFIHYVSYSFWFLLYRYFKLIPLLHLYWMNKVYLRNKNLVRFIRTISHLHTIILIIF